MIGPCKDATGKWLTLAIFWEERHAVYEPSYTLKGYDLEKDGVVYPSLKNIFMDYSDPTEYSFAVEMLGGWDHWQALNKSYALAPIFQGWREELEVKLRCEALKAMRRAALEEGSKGVSAAKYLAEKGWEKTRGRPSKDELAREERVRSDIKSELDADAERVGMH
jgi:hypothetical protein